MDFHGFFFLNIESKNQEVTEQETNSSAKNDLSAIQNHNLLIALARSSAANTPPFAMPVSFHKSSLSIHLLIIISSYF